LAQLKADIRLMALSPNRWGLTIGNSDVGTHSESESLDIVGSILEKLAELGPEARATDLVASVGTQVRRRSPPPVGSFALRRGDAIGIALPFGTATAQTVERLVKIAGDESVTTFRPAPQHGLLAIGASPAFAARAAELGFITSSADPRLRVSACIGSQGCASGHIPARALAERLAPLVEADEHLHVSGCAKGCAHPRRAELTIVGRVDGHGLVIGGTAGDTPQVVLRADELESAVAAR
jgi:precorrin-3B synthase